MKRLIRPVTLRPVAKVGSPVQLVRYAEKLRAQDPGAFDEVWCVVDVDEFDINEAIAVAKTARISLAISNPCFELWLILHFDDCTAELSTPKAALARLRKCLPSYEKCQFDFEVFAGQVDGAVGRAKALEDRAEGKLVNPSTGMWRLAEVVLTR